jgi:tRNA(His) guanylyltransferase
MAKSKYEYVKQFELDDTLLPGCWVVVRVDGKGFTKFTAEHGFEKPNDKRALDLMDTAAKEVMETFPDVRLAYGESDEYSFVIRKGLSLHGRRSSKLVSLLTSCFTGSYVRNWSQFFPDTPLQRTPIFDGRAVCYPTDPFLRDYLCWRQADTHVNNQYNTVFWALVKSGCTPAEAQATLKGTDTAAKNELMFSKFGINYAHLPEQFRKGSTIVRRAVQVVVKEKEDGTKVERMQQQLVVLYCDIMKQTFWDEHPELLAE